MFDSRIEVEIDVDNIRLELKGLDAYMHTTSPALHGTHVEAAWSPEAGCLKPGNPVHSRPDLGVVLALFWNLSRLRC